MDRRAQDELQRHRRRLRARRVAPSVVAAVAALSIATAASAGEVRRIRLCADPSNPPFSSQDPKSPGFEVEIARVIAETVGADFGVHWFPTAREILVFRQLHEDRCDLVMGLPVTSRFTDDKPRLAFSIPYYVMRQALVSPSVGGVRSAGELGPKLVESGAIKVRKGGLKVLGDGEITKAVTVKAHKFSASAKEKIEKAGGKADVIVVQAKATPQQRKAEEKKAAAAAKKA